MKNDGNPQKRRIIYLCAFLLPLCMVQIFFALCRVYPYGGASILTGDLDLEFVNFYSYFINIFRSKNDFSYMLSKTIGGDYPGLAAFQLHDPLLFLLFFFPGEKIALGIEVLFSVQIALAGLFMSILLNHRYQTSFVSLIFSTAYSFCGFFFGYLVLTIFFGCLLLLPLVLYFFLAYLDGERSRTPFIITAALYIYINYYMGFMLVIFLVLLYIARVIEDTGILKKLPDFIISGVTVLLIDGFFLIRTGLSLLGEKTVQGADYGFYRRFPFNQVFAQLFSGTSRNDLMPLIYCSVLVIFFSLIYFLSGRFLLRQKLSRLFLLLSILVSMWINALDTIWHGFNNPEGFYWRYAYLISLILIITAYQGYIALFQTDAAGIVENEKAASLKKAVIAFLLPLFYLFWLILSKNRYMDRERLIINLVLLVGVAGSVMLCLQYEGIRKYAFLALCVLSCGDMLYNAKTAYYALNAYETGLPEIAQFTEDYRTIGDAVSYIKEQDDGLYRLEKDFNRTVNDPALFDYMGLSHDSSCEKDEILDWMTYFGFCKTVYYTYYNGGSTSFADDFFGVRYFISRFDEIPKPYTRLPYTGKYYVFQNEGALPLAFRAPEGLIDYSPEEEDQNTFETQNALIRFWSDKRPVYRSVAYETELRGAVEEEPGHYRKTGETGMIVYNIPITEELPLYLYFKAPKRQQGELFVNGMSFDQYFTVNHWNVLCAGIFPEGERVEIAMEIEDEALTITEPCFYYEDTGALKEWEDIASQMNETVGAVEEQSSSHLFFTVDAKEEESVVLSLPYDTAWRITCDGERIEPVKAAGMLLGLSVPAGSHRIEMKYIPEGTFAGAIVSVLGLLLFACHVTVPICKANRALRCKR